MKSPSLTLRATFAIAILAVISFGPVQAEDSNAKATTGKPLKVYILSGQSNADGWAGQGTINAMRGDPEVAELYKDMTDKDGNPITVEDVYIITGDDYGKLTTKFGAKTRRGRRMGTEYTFGIYMHKHLKEPILIIKAAWGAKNLIQEFRPPSAGPFEKEVDSKGKETGWYYQWMLEQIKNALADPSKIYPAYDKKAGYEIAGFIWFQGYKDMNDPHYQVDPADKESAKDYSEYTRLMACFIRDVRKDLSAPDMKFVIGAIGVGGDKDQKQVDLAKAQGATADMPEFKDNVGVVYTASHWDHELGDFAKDAGKRESWIKRRVKSRQKSGASKDEVNAYRAKLYEEKFTEEEREKLKGISNAELHYLGSAKIVGRIGKAFAEEMIHLKKK